MKLISAFFVAAAIGLGLQAWKYFEPMTHKTTGTSVVGVVVDKTGRHGNQPLASLLPNNLSEKQKDLLDFAYIVAKEDGNKHPEYLQGILMQESKAGGMKEFQVAGLQNNPGDRYFGVGQLKLDAAKDVMKAYPALWKFLDTKTDEELQAKLILDNHFNIRVASKYLLIMGINHNAEAGVTAYNQGVGGASKIDAHTWHYTRAVETHIARLGTR